MAFALPEFRGGLSAAEVDRSLRSALAALDAARQCALVWFCEVLSRSLYRDLGYASMEQYATEALGFSRNRYWQFMKMAGDLERLEPLRQAVLGGRLEWTKAQQVGRVATPETTGAGAGDQGGAARGDDRGGQEGGVDPGCRAARLATSARVRCAGTPT
jgi:hypothetical protein